MKQFRRAAVCFAFLVLLAGCAAEPKGGEPATEEAESKKAASVPVFESKNLSMDTVTNEIFAQADLTVLNVWGTFCGPCIGEMPDLAEWSKEMPENVQLVGLIIDIEGEEDTQRIELAKEIMEEAGADFVNIIADSDWLEFTENIIGVPTTYFVDKEGTLVGKPVVGADVVAYQKFVKEYLNE